MFKSFYLSISSNFQATLSQSKVCLGLVESVFMKVVKFKAGSGLKGTERMSVCVY